MFFDVDDLVHRYAVSYARESACGSYVADHGYAFDCASGTLEYRLQDFDHHCGSTFVARFARDELPVSWDDESSRFSLFGSPPDQVGHRDYKHLAAELGRPPRSFPFPAVVYLINHADSAWSAEVGRPHGRARGRQVMWPNPARHILIDDFAAEDLAGGLAGPAMVVATRARQSVRWRFGRCSNAVRRGGAPARRRR